MTTPEEQIRSILERNKRVEADKAWEVSWYRKITLAIAIYIITAFFLWSIDIRPFWNQSLVPPGAYLFSTLSIPWLKKRWIEKHQG